MQQASAAKSPENARPLVPKDIDFAEKPVRFISDDVLRECSELFSNHYGVWGANPYNMKPGNRVKMSSGALRKQLVTVRIAL
jgi:hypothetical protein